MAAIFGKQAQPMPEHLKAILRQAEAMKKEKKGL